ncbi:MAG: amidohydrolase, partial [Sphingobacteriaceae bacterium]
MKKFYFLPLTIFSFSAFAQTSYKAQVSKQADALEKQVIAWRRDFHEHPELGNHEVRTS